MTKYQLLYIITPINTKKRKFGKSNRFGCEKEAETNVGWTALHLAIMEGHIEVVDYLIKTCQLDSKAKGDDGLTALHHASDNGHFEIVKYLMETCDVETEAKDCDGLTALHYASENGFLEIVKYLIETCQVDISITDNAGKTAYDIYQETMTSQITLANTYIRMVLTKQLRLF